MIERKTFARTTLWQCTETKEVNEHYTGITLQSMDRKSLTINDPDINGYKKMLCIETANAFIDEQCLDPGKRILWG
jgi:D-hexose-6-phosphate mutarotase